MRALPLLLSVGFVACAGAPVPPVVQPSPTTARPQAALAPPPQRFATPPFPPYAYADPQRRTKVAAAFPELEKLYGRVRDDAKLEGLVIGVVMDDDLVWSHAWGYRDVETKAAADVDTVFRIGSMTKTFTATAMLALRDAGKLALDDRADKWIPELAQVVYATRDVPPITVRNLLTHSSGLPQFGPFDFCDPRHELTEDDVVRNVPGSGLAFATDTFQDYSTYGMGLAGTIVGRASGVGYRAYVSRALLGPLGMTESAWNEEDVPREHFAKGYVRGEDGTLKNPPNFRVGATSGAGAMYSSVRDLAKWVAFNLAAWPPRDDADDGPVRRSSLREMTRSTYAGRVWEKPAPPSSPWATEATTHWNGLGWGAQTSCDFDLAVAHGGGEEDGYAGYMEFLPRQGVGFVALWNFGSMAPFDVEDDALRILLNAVGRQQPKAAPNAGLLEAQRRVDELLARWDDTKAHALLDTLFYDAISDASPRAAWEEIPKKYGACRPDGTIDADNQLVGRWHLTCERGLLAMEVDLVSAEPLRIRHLVFDERHVPGPTVSRVADRVAALTARWVDADARGLVATKAAVADLKATLAPVGKCTVAEPLDGGDDRAGSFRLACERGPRRLELKLEASGERAATFAVRPMLAPGERCLRR
jgi:CubicO group peptidase (beta-lactamase class C family)